MVAAPPTIELPFIPVALCVALALVPAGFSWWSGRQLRRRLDDALFPERLQAHRRRVLLASFVMAGVALGILPSFAPATIGILLLALSAAAYPLRKAIHGETWTYGAYLSWVGRFVLAFGAIWVAVGSTPFLILAIDRPVWRIAAALVAAVVFVIWITRHMRVARWLVGPQPLTDADRLAAFGAILSRSRLSEAAIDVVAPKGGVWFNALALASFRDRRVWLGRTLLERLTPGETLAIFSHEVAHLEQFSDAFLWRLRVIDLTSIALATLGVAGISLTMPDVPHVGLLLGWGVTFLLLLAVRGYGHQRRETESDLRAVELCGDSDSLVSALIKLHAAMRLPRRWAENVERGATHPSLASRIRTLRELGAAQPETPLTECQVFRTPEGAIILDPARAHWLEGLAEVGGDPAALFDRASKARSVSYSSVRELRVEAGVEGQARLVARDTSGHRWSVPIDEGDTARLQRTLDAIESRLAPRLVSGIPAGAAQALAIAAIMLGLLQSAWGLVLCSCAALVRLRPTSLIMLAAAATTSAVLSLQQSASSGGVLPLSVLIPAEGLVAAASIWWALRQFREQGTRWEDGPPIVLVVVGAGAVVAWGIALTDFVSAPGLVRAHQIAQATPAAAVLAAALAVTLLAARTRPRRTAGFVTAIVAIAAVAVGSPALLFSLERDPLLARTPVAAVTSARSTLVHVADVGESEYNGPLRLSPSGRRYAIGSQAEGEETPVDFRIGAFGRSGRQTIRALDVAWASDDRLLVLKASDRGGSQLLLLDARTEKTTLTPRSKALPIGWSLPAIVAPRLTAVDGGRGWMIVGWTSTLQRRAIRLTGALAGPEINQTEWDVPRDGYVEAVTAGAAGNALAVSHRLPGVVPLLWALRRSAAAELWTDSTIWALTQDGPRRVADTALTARCTDTIDGGRVAWCVAMDAQRTIVYRANVPLGQLEAVTTVEQTSNFEANGPDGSLILWAGWIRPILVQPSQHTAIELEDDAIPMALTSAGRGGLISFVSAADDSAQIRVLEVREPSA
jgi:Zn-dependent protease with chaperone function